MFGMIKQVILIQDHGLTEFQGEKTYIGFLVPFKGRYEWCVR